MKNIVVFLAGILMAASLAAQKITLEEAIRRALDSREELKAQSLQVQIAQSQNDKVRAQWLPKVSGSADFRWNTQLQTTLLPLGQFGLPGIDPEATKEVAFGAAVNNVLALQLEQKIYDGNRKVDRALNDAQAASAQNQLALQQIDIRYAVAEAYYAALYHREKVKLAEQNLARNSANLEIGQTRLKDGTALKNDVDRLSLDVSNAQLSLKKARQDMALSLDNLRYLIRSDSGEAPEPAEDLAALVAAHTAGLSPRTGLRPEIRAEEINLQINDLNRQKELVQRRPTVSAYGNYSVLQLHDVFNPFAEGTWYPYNYLGIRTEIPIFDGKQAKLAANDFELRSQISRLNLEKLKSDFNYESQSALKTLEQAQLDLDESQKNIDLARQIFETDAFRFRQGVLLQNDLKNSEFSLQTAENNYLTAVYNWLVADLKYRKATGNL